MRDAVIVDAVRTPVGKRGGALSAIHPADLSAHVLEALRTRTDVDVQLIDDVVWGCVSAVGEQTMDIARTAALSAGWPETVAGATVDRQCGSSQQAVHFAAACVIAGQYEIAVAGGVESMSRVPMGAAWLDQDPRGRLYRQRYGQGFYTQFRGAQDIAERWRLSREQLDEAAADSQRKATAATAEGRFAAQITRPPAVAEDLDDEGVRPGTTVQTLAGLRAVHDGGLLTAGNSSPISDGAAALLITTSDNAAALGLHPLARIHTAVVTGSPAEPMLTGPIPATAKALQRSGLSLDDIGAFECNEAFASVLLAWQAETGADPKLVNQLGGAIALGHPLGASGARIMTTLVHHMKDNGIRFGLQTMCEGGGQANATILELL